MLTLPADRTQFQPPSGSPLAFERRVGVEIEFLGIGAAAAATALGRDLGGVVESEDAHAFEIRGTALGTLRVEADLRHLHPHRHPHLKMRLPPRIAAIAGHLLSPIVPRELVTGPLPVQHLPWIDEAVASLRSAGATGDGAVLLDSLGLHFNVDPPRLDVETIMAFLKAYMLLSDDLRNDASHGRRRLRMALPTDFPQAYRRLVLDAGYRPDLATFIDDYLQANPTRRRPLDLLPILAHLSPAQVRSRLPREKISPRAAFHYRLPHAHVGDPGWSVMQAWRGWERLEAAAVQGDPLK